MKLFTPLNVGLVLGIQSTLMQHRRRMIMAETARRSGRRMRYVQVRKRKEK